MENKEIRQGKTYDTDSQRTVVDELKLKLRGKLIFRGLCNKLCEKVLGHINDHSWAILNQINDHYWAIFGHINDHYWAILGYILMIITGPY